MTIRARQLRPQSPRAFTLVEMVSSLVIVGILFGATMSLMRLASSATIAPDDPATRALAAMRIEDRIASDLAAAIEIVSATPTSIEFKVADRNNDATFESITYAWNSATSTLTYTYNADSPVTLLTGVTAFTFSLDVLTRSVSLATGTTTIGPTTLAEYTPTAGNVTKETMGIGKQFAQTVLPTLPAGAIAYSITSVTFWGEVVAPATGIMAINFREPLADGKPSGTVIESKSVNESTFNSTTGTTVAFTAMNNIPATKPACLVASAFIALPDTGAIITAGSGAVDAASSFHKYESLAWSTVAGRSFHYRLTGTYTMPTYTSITQQHLHAVRIKATYQGQDRTPIFRVPARPILPGVTATTNVVGALQ